MRAVIDGIAVCGSPGEIVEFLERTATKVATKPKSTTPPDCAALYQAIQDAAGQVATASANLQGAIDEYVIAGCQVK